jgi:hypothetical protein
MAVSWLHGSGHTTLHKITIDKKNYPYHASPKLYAETGTYVGITEVELGDKLEPKVKLSELISTGKIRKIKCRDEKGNSFSLLCVADNLTKSIGNILATQIDGNAIRTAWIPIRVGFR